MGDLPVFAFLEFPFGSARSKTGEETMNDTLFELSGFHKQLRDVMEVQVILEITSSVSLRSPPPIFPKGFQKLFENFGGMVGEVFTLPFYGQHSCFSTSSGALKRDIR